MKKMILYITICFFPLLVRAQENDGISAYYPFLGSASDASGNGAFGVPSGGPVLVEDRFGYPDGAYSFDGIDDYIVVLDTQYVDIPDDFSLGFWIKPTGNPATNTVLLSKHYEPLYNEGTWWVGLTPDMKFVFKGTPYFDYDEMISGNTIPLDNWSHLFFTYNDSTYQWAMYINGEVDTTNYLSLAIDNTDKDLYIGTMINTNPFGLVNHFQGAIDEVRIYQRALAAAEVNALFNASPQFSFTPDSVQFGNVAPGAVVPRQVKIENTGNAELRVDSVQIHNDSDNVFDTYAPGFTILPGDSEIVQVNFGPTMPGEFSAELNFASNTRDTSIALSGTGMGPLLSVPADEINFGFISVNEDSVIVLAIHNSGNDTLNLYYAEILGNDAGDFGLSHGNPIPPVAPEDSVFMEIQFSPQTAGYKTAQLVLFSDAPSSPDSVAIIGEAEGQSEVNVEPETQPVAGDSLNFSVTPPPAFQPDVRILYYRQPGESTWRSVALDSAETDYRGFIPPDSVTYKGIEYYVYLSDGENEITFPAVNPQISPASVQVAVDSVAAELKLQPGVYKMFSAPLLPNNANLINLLMDNYGYFESKHWRLLQWSAQDSGYLEMSDSLEFYLAPGTAFWLITRSGEVFDIENCMSMDLSQPFSYTLNPGWNQIGNPFPFPVATDTIRNADLLEAPVYYNGDQYLYNRTVLNPWDGYFVYNPTEALVTVEIPPIPAPAGVQKKSLFSEFDLAEEFYIQISAEMSNTLLVDDENYLGLKIDAAADYDKSDLSEAPPIDDYVRISIIEGKHRYAVNFKPINETGQHWQLAIDGTIPRRNIIISVAEFGTMPDNYRLHILDEDYQCPIQVQNGKFNIAMGDSGTVRHLKIILGTENYAQNHNDGISLTPVSNSLYQNYPNPFNPQTTISYQTGRRGLVELEIYNMLGQKIRTLVHENQSPGQHQIEWNGTNDAGYPVASGIYMYSLKTGSFIQTRKLVLIR